MSDENAKPAANDALGAKLREHSGYEAGTEAQMILNEPTKDSRASDPKDAEFLQLLIGKIEKKEIDLYKPSSLINNDVYIKLDGAMQAKVETDAFNLLATIREINTLFKTGYHDSFQIMYLVNKIRLTKERLENIEGDVYII